jgi:hypothetical protein
MSTVSNLLKGDPERVVMEFVGWSNSTMAKRCQHVTAAVRGTAANRLGRFLCEEN